MKISVVISNYNYGRYLQATLDSVWAQTNTDYEVILVDDGSTDDSREILDRLKHPRLNIIFQINGGQAAAFNTAMAKATGELIAFLDADDLWDPSKLTQAEAAFRNDSELSLYTHNFRKIDAEGRVTTESVLQPQQRPRRLADAILRTELDLSIPPSSFVVGKRKDLMPIFPLDEPLWRIAADTPVILAMAFAGATLVDQQVLGSYRWHGRNHGNTHTERDLLPFYEKYFACANAFAEKHGLTERAQFHHTDFYLGQMILQHARWTPLGLYFRAMRAYRKNRRAAALQK